MIPEHHGLEALQQIIAYDEAAKVVMVTAASQKNKMVDALRFGAAEFLAKPFEQNQIIDIIHRVLS